MSEMLPEGWVETTIAEYAIIPDSKGVEGKIPYLEIGDINIISKVYELKSKPAVKGCKTAKKNDVLISRVRPTRGAITLIKENEIFVSSAFSILRFHEEVESKTVFYQIAYNTNFLNYLGESCTGTMYPTVSEQIIKNYAINIPPLNEQKRIVAKLDAVMPCIEAVKGRLDKVPAILKRFRQSVLTAAVTGKLTEQWREDHPEVESAEVLLERIRKDKNKLYKQNKIVKPITEEDIAFPVPLIWQWCRLSEIAFKMSTGPFGTMLHKSDYIDNGIPVINPTNIKDEKLIPSEKMMISGEKHSELSRYALQEGNIVIARRGDLSKCGIVTKNEIDWLCGTGSFFLEIAIDPVYFRFFYISDYCQAPLNADSIGSTMSNLNQAVLSNVPFPLPPLEEQKEIIRQVDKLFALADKVEDHYKKAKTKVGNLSQSVLAKAFRGELVPQDPNDEPAEKLLERIMEEKAKMESALKAMKKKAPSERKGIKQVKSKI